MLQNTTISYKFTTAYYKVLQSITKYYSVLLIVLRTSPYYKVPLRTPIYKELLCTTKYYYVLQTTSTYYKVQLCIQKKFGGQTFEYGQMNSRDGKGHRKSIRETEKESGKSQNMTFLQ